MECKWERMGIDLRLKKENSLNFPKRCMHSWVCESSAPSWLSPIIFHLNRCTCCCFLSGLFSYWKKNSWAPSTIMKNREKPMETIRWLQLTWPGTCPWAEFFGNNNNNNKKKPAMQSSSSFSSFVFVCCPFHFHSGFDPVTSKSIQRNG